ncbi:response regulator transcription factor [Xanthovirga aplysinae]|uniref:response regulator transcription factor n=1 Tax=Xanthovirga aplysinae TaxID=2529853 RepID=UPI0012BCD00B|nr:response regulator transcription factor [Xanthovirga aplysinae]MTI33543.1 response regulator transcription factor [Xanthovirga aplysinae]
MKILVIEDEPSVSNFIKKGLEERKHDVMTAYDGPTGISLAAQNNFDVIITDIIMPGMNGIEVCKKLRNEKQINAPIIMLTALGSTDDVVTGLDAGADDYITKPLKFNELMARIRAVDRRSTNTVSKNVIKVADLEIDQDSKVVKRNGQFIKLTTREFLLLQFLAKNKEKVISRVEILENVWEVNFDLGTNVIDVYVNYLRNKIDKNYEPKLIHTVIGMGYVLKEGE